MSSKNRSYTITKNGEFPDLRKVIKKAIYNNAVEFLNPPIKNIGYKGIFKTSSEIKKWFRTSQNIKKDFQTSASLMERGGTGGSIFRNMYTDFLKESSTILELKQLEQASKQYKEIAFLWRQVSNLFEKIGDTENLVYVNQASEILIELSEKERSTMEKLKNVCT